MKPVYLLLTDTGTWFTRLIRLYTGDRYNHASIAFDPGLREMYSFGRKKPHNPLIGGFVRECAYGPLFVRAECALYSCTLSNDAYFRMRKIIREMKREQHQYKYNLLGLFALMFNTEIERERAYFCSQFVASLFAESGCPLSVKPPALTTPGELADSPRLRLVYQGPLLAYLERVNAPSPDAFDGFYSHQVS